MIFSLKFETHNHADVTEVDALDFNFAQNLRDSNFKHIYIADFHNIYSRRGTISIYLLSFYFIFKVFYTKRMYSIYTYILLLFGKYLYYLFENCQIINF